VDEVAHPLLELVDLLGHVDRDRQRHVAVRHAEDEVVALLAERLALLLLLDDGRTVVRVDDLVAGLEGHGILRWGRMGRTGNVRGYRTGVAPAGGGA
jgi:hypothetical protein